MSAGTPADAAGAPERALEAALTLFLRDGVSAASIDDVCRTARVSVGSLYHHYPGKDGLAGALYADCLARFQAYFAQRVRAERDAEAGIRAGVRAHLRWCLRLAPDRARFLLFFEDAARGPAGERLEALNREFFTAVLGWWRPHVSDGHLRDVEVELAYPLWLGPAQEYCRACLRGRGRVAMSRATEVLEDGAWWALRPVPD